MWETNLAEINQHNKEAGMGHHSYWMGVNQFTDMVSKNFLIMIFLKKQNKCFKHGNICIYLQ